MPVFEENQTVFVVRDGTAVSAKIHDPRPKKINAPDGETTTAYLIERRTPDFRRIAWIDERWIFTDEESAKDAIARKGK
ncbi:MAG: hypothetical protein HDQ88_08265 [Clostridia bacterium]|nr:hypothetical protein [Clostridia bacterium]